MRDEWTALTKDRSLSAQFEHTVAIIDTGCEVLTERNELIPKSEDVLWADIGPRSAPAAYRWRQEQSLQAAAQ